MVKESTNMRNLVSGCSVSYRGVAFGNPTTNSVKKHPNPKPFAIQTIWVISKVFIST